ncbi:MAG: hypothetical protein GC149_14295 [Gammaproteobacteria bacterium]|nr:hypothetical protein [Gammaproteobacteria bacterium]
MFFHKDIGSFQLKHLFAVAGFISTTLAIIALTIFYRDLVISDLVFQGERQNQLLAQTALNSVRAELISYLHKVNDVSTTSPEKHVIPDRLEKVIENTLSNIYVARIKIYNKNGTIVYSTNGKDMVHDDDNPGFTSAMAGKIESKLKYRDIFSLFNRDSEIDNLVESYLPVREREDLPILGVFEIYTDVSAIVKEIEHTEIMIMLGVIVILLLLYGLLLAIVRRVSNTLEHQQSVIQERTHTLELLSSQLLNSQEYEKKAIARDLHENIAQTLAGIKNVIEAALTKQAAQKKSGSPELKNSIRLLQDSIGEIRNLAMQIRPPSLDDFGLVKTLEWLCRQYQILYPEVTIVASLALDESALSDEHKSIIYRVAEDTLDSLLRSRSVKQISVTLGKQDELIKLIIEDDSMLPDDFEAYSNNTMLASIPLYNMRKRTILSGGVFTIEKKSDNRGTIASSSWAAN